MPENNKSSNETFNLDNWTIEDAVRYSRVDVLKLMLQRRGRLDDVEDPIAVYDFSGRTLLDFAINTGDGMSGLPHMEIITLLLESGLQHGKGKKIMEQMGQCAKAIVRTNKSGWFKYFRTQPPEFSEIERLCELVINTAPVNRRDYYRRYYMLRVKTPWEERIARQSGNVQMSEIKEDAYLASWDLSSAAGENRSDIARALIARGDDVNFLVDESRWFPGYTPLHYAAGSDSPDVARLLIDHGAEIDARSDDGFTALHGAAINVIPLLIDHGAEIDARDNDGFTALYYASQDHVLNVARLLIEKGANTDGIDLSWMDDHEDA